MHTAGPTVRILTLSAVLALTACASESSHSSAKAAPPAAAPATSAGAHAQISEQHSARVGVVAVDKAQRLVTLRGEDGRIFQVKAGDEVRNFDQIKAGDKVKVKYMEALAVELKKDGKAVVGRTESSGMTSAAKGEKPGAVAMREVVAVADVVNVDAAKQLVQVKNKDGKIIDLNVKDPEQLKLIKKGDQVQATYTEAVAISVEPMAAAKK